MIRAALSLIVLLGVLAGCAGKQPFADQSELDAVRYVDNSEYYVTVLTMVSNRNGAGAHSTLIINAQERILFDPAGSFYRAGVPERNDVLFGISPRVEFFYKSAHARASHHVVSQKIPVSFEAAQRAYATALQYGGVGPAFCTSATSDIVSSLPGYEGISQTMFPANLMKQLEAYPNVEIDKYYEDDNPDLDAALRQAQQEALQSGG